MTLKVIIPTRFTQNHKYPLQNCDYILKLRKLIEVYDHDRV